MSDYLHIANSNILFIMGGVIVLFVLLQAVLFIRHAWNEGLKICLARQQMLKSLRSGMISAIVPSIPIVVTLISMVAVLGIPVPWIRLSVIGSGPYELLAAGIGAKSMGVEKLGGVGYTAQVFANSAWVMTVGAMWSSLIVFFFLRKIGNVYKRIENGDSSWMEIVSSSAFFGVVCIFIAEPLTQGGLSLITLLSGAVLMTVCAVLVFKCKMAWLKEFALPLSMIGAMVCAVLFA